MAKSVNAILLVLAAVLLVPFASHAAGLGTLTLRSALGQPLDAEIEVVALQPGEDLQVQLAPGEAYRDAGVDLSPSLLGARFAIERRDGRTVIRVRTTQPVNDPFLSVLVEVQWATGRLARQYTVLVDPVEFKTAAAPAPVAPVIAAVQAAPAVPGAPAVSTAPTQQATDGSDTYRIKRGDTLGDIARKWKPEGVTQQQMLVGLYQTNRSAFIRDNINLIRAGATLFIPGRAEVLAISAANAARQVTTHMAAFSRYRGTAVSAGTGSERISQGQREVISRRAGVKRSTRAM